MNTVSILSQGLSTQQIADKLHVTKQTVRNWLTRGCNGFVLRSFKIGGKRVITPDDLELFLQSILTEGFEQKEPVQTPVQQTKAYRKAEKEYADFVKNFSKN
jgi:transposase